MPAIQNPTQSTILVTGANGFAAAWIVDGLLKQGYTVRASVRSADKGKYLQEVFKSFGDKIEIVITGDMSKSGTFDEAVKGVDGIIHSAAQVHLNAVEPNDIIEPAIEGNLNIMRSALKYGDRLKRIIITSSGASMTAGGSPEPITISEKNWNESSVKECEEKGRDASGIAKYSASKILSEKAGWDFYEKHKSEIGWDVTFLHPTWIFGPTLHEVASIDKLNGPNLLWHNVITTGDCRGLSPRLFPSTGWIDVRDVALGHVRSLEVEEAGGERIILCSGPFVFQDFIDVVNSLQPSPWPSHKKPFTKGEAGEKIYKIVWDMSKEKKILGIKFRTQNETARDMLADWESRGWN
ncbi:hypothetical protein VKT23_010740 [Stygiomarasmius scandens]|uniref:NAD-dependent epimerase/dehydratase domain-containing protein n=1 Tax=Marasmiellus scandens TaxID=2682957 RepID=A0ABR1JBZ1_9AGAR